MKTSEKITTEINAETQYGLALVGNSKDANSKRKASLARVEFLRECLRIVQILTAESIQGQYQKVLEKIGKHELEVRKANSLPSPALVKHAITVADEYYKISQLAKQRDVLEYIIDSDLIDRRA